MTYYMPLKTSDKKTARKYIVFGLSSSLYEYYKIYAGTNIESFKYIKTSTLDVAENSLLSEDKIISEDLGFFSETEGSEGRYIDIFGLTNEENELEKEESIKFLNSVVTSKVKKLDSPFKDVIFSPFTKNFDEQLARFILIVMPKDSTKNIVLNIESRGPQVTVGSRKTYNNQIIITPTEWRVTNNTIFKRATTENSCVIS